MVLVKAYIACVLCFAAASLGVFIVAVQPSGTAGGAAGEGPAARNDWVWINYTYRRFPLEESAASSPQRSAISPCLFQQQNSTF